MACGRRRGRGVVVDGGWGGEEVFRPVTSIIEECGALV